MHAEQSTPYSGFVHDDWRVNNRLTLNPGIRYEAEGALRKRWNRSWGGWQLQGIYTYQSGRPIPITSNGTIFTGNFADLNGGEVVQYRELSIANQQLSNVRTFRPISNLRLTT